MRKLRSLSLISLVVVLLLSACSSDDKDSSSTTTSSATLTQSTTLATNATQSELQVRVRIDFTGATSATQPSVIKTASVPDNTTAWDAIRQALGQENIKFTDYGGSLGIFITGLYGVEPAGNSFWEFIVNGKSSEVGVSQYIVKQGDDIQFKISS